MAAIRFKWNHKAFRDLLRGPEVQADLEARADAIADAAGDQFEAEAKATLRGAGSGSAAVFVGKNRARATVRSVSPLGSEDHAKLLGALDAGR